MVFTTVNNFRDFLLIGTILMAGCISSPAQNLNALVGSWVGCDSKGEYVEIHFSKYESLFVNRMILDANYAVPYSIIGNEIHYTNVRLQKNFISYFEKNGEKLVLRDDFEIYHLSRISDFPIVPPSSLNLGGNQNVADSILVTHYERMFFLRNAKHECEG